MFKLIQRVSRFRISEFKEAVQKMESSKDEDWRKKLPYPIEEKIKQTYFQATEGYKMETPYSPIGEADQQEVQFWSKHMGLNEEKAQQDYVRLVNDILQQNQKNIYGKEQQD